MSYSSPLGGLSSVIYQPGMSENMFSDREARREYARLRKVANRRIARLEKAGYGGSRLMTRYGGGFESLRGASAAAVREKLWEVASFLEKKTSSVTGQRAAKRKFVDTMQSLGYDINMKNADAYGRFMDAVSRHYGSKQAYDSEQMYKIFKGAEKSKRVTPTEVAKNIDYWVEHMDQLPIPKAAPGDYA